MRPVVGADDPILFRITSPLLLEFLAGMAIAAALRRGFALPAPAALLALALAFAFMVLFARSIKTVRLTGSIQYACLVCFVGGIILNTFEERLVGFNIVILSFSIVMYMNLRDGADRARAPDSP